MPENERKVTNYKMALKDRAKIYKFHFKFTNNNATSSLTLRPGMPAGERERTEHSNLVQICSVRQHENIINIAAFMRIYK